VSPASTILWTPVTASSTLAPDSGYIIDLTSVSGNVDLTLPTGAAIGASIYLIYNSSTNLLKKAIVRRGTHLINGNAWDYQFYKELQQVQLRYTGPTKGWVVTTDGPFDRFQPAVVFAKPATTTVPQNGIIQYLGSELGTVSYSSPAAPITPRPRRVIHIAPAAWSGSFASATDKNSAGSSSMFVGSGSFANNGFGFLFYNWITNTPIQVKLDAVFIQWGASASYRPDVFSIKAAKDFGPLITYSNIATTINSTTGMASLGQDSRILASPTWTRIVDIASATSGYTGNYYGNTAASLSRIYDTPSPEFYPIYWFEPLYPVFNAGSPPFTDIRQIEFYGEVIGS
jgi:hypothetical protein